MGNYFGQSANILNAIRNDSTVPQMYRDSVPVTRGTRASVRNTTSIIINNDDLFNTFLTSMINRVGAVYLKNKMLNQPWGIFKRDVMEYGNIVENVFVDIAKPHSYDPSVAESEIYKREIPDVKTQFFIINFYKFYKQTIQVDTLKQALLSDKGLYDLTDKIVLALLNGERNDEFLAMKYMLAREILAGNIETVAIPTVTKANAHDIVSVIKSTSNDLTFPNRKYNHAGVMNQTEKSEQFLICNSYFDSVMDVNVLASAFNMDKAEFAGRRMLVDGFGKFDTERLALLFADSEDYVPFTDEELAQLESIPAIIVDDDFFVLIDTNRKMGARFNEEGLYWNYWLHVWKTFGISAFSQAAIFVPGESAITSVTVTPSTLELVPNTTSVLRADVETVGFANKDVTWTSSDTAVAEITPAGVLTAKATGTAVITATSVADTTKAGTCTVTVGSEQGVDSVNVYPSAMTLGEGATAEINAVVVAHGAINKNVTWSSNNVGVTITGSTAVTDDVTGVTTITATVNVAQGATGTATITATSDGDTTKSDTCIVTIQSGGGGGTFNPEMTPMEITVGNDAGSTIYGISLLTVPQGANYVVNLVGFEVPTFGNEPIIKTLNDDTSGYFTVGHQEDEGAFTFVSYATAWSNETVLGLKIAPYGQYLNAMDSYGTSDGQGGRTATGTATVTITDLDNGTSAVKEITVNFTYTA